ncbi:microfibril-associated glycoprotein 4-like isoform X2 [Ciona intestinalis]
MKWIYLTLLLILVAPMLESVQVNRGSFQKNEFSKSPKRYVNVLYLMCLASTPVHVKATARPTDPLQPHTFNVTVIDIQRYSVLVRLERTDQESGWDEIPITVDWVSMDEPDEKGVTKTNKSNCKAILDSGLSTSGKYQIQLKDSTVVEVYCDMETDGGGWTVIQRRKDGSVNFTRNWANYSAGFGTRDGEHWLGLATLNKLTTIEKYDLRVNITGCNNLTKYAQYSLEVNGYSGNARDSLAYHNGQIFQTFDRNGGKCVKRDRGGWWYNNCVHANLNGLYAPCSSGEMNAGWYYFNYEYRGTRFIEMKIRPRN